jgi:hypothetical protein
MMMSTWSGMLTLSTVPWITSITSDSCAHTALFKRIGEHAWHVRQRLYEAEKIYRQPAK